MVASAVCQAHRQPPQKLPRRASCARADVRWAVAALSLVRCVSGGRRPVMGSISPRRALQGTVAVRAYLLRLPGRDADEWHQQECKHRSETGHHNQQRDLAPVHRCHMEHRQRPCWNHEQPPQSARCRTAGLTLAKLCSGMALGPRDHGPPRPNPSVASGTLACPRLSDIFAFV